MQRDPESEVTMVSIANLLDSHLKSFAEDLKSSLATNSIKLNDLESAITGLKAHVAALEISCTTLTESNAKLTAKVIDLEACSHRNNIRIVGIPESIEGPRPTDFFSKMLADVFGEVLDSPPDCGRAHCSLAHRLAPGQRPRPVVIILLRFQVKDATIWEVQAKRGKLSFQGHPVHVFKDYPPEVVERRKEYSEVMSQLFNLGLKPALHYLAKLSIKLAGGSRQSFSSVVEAESFIATQSRV